MRKRARVAGRRSRLQVIVTDGAGRPHALGRGLGRWLAGHAPRSARGTVAIALVGDARMRTLNRTFRGVDRATDVLSFPAFPPSPRLRAASARLARTFAPASPRVPAAPVDEPGLGPHVPRLKSLAPRAGHRAPSLGDLAIALGVADRQARAEGHDLLTELRILALHGLLHLLGYDHERDGGTMRTVEERLRRRAGLPAGLIARTRPRGRSLRR